MRFIISFCFVLALLLIGRFTAEGNSCGIIENDSLPQQSLRAKAMALNNQAIKMQMSLKEDSLKEAMSLLKDAIRIDSSYSLAYINLAEIQCGMGQVEESVRTLKCVLKKECINDKNILFGIANCYDILEEPDSAQIYYRESLDVFTQTICSYPDSIQLLANQHFVSFVANNDTTFLVKFLKKYEGKYPNVDFLKESWSKITKEKYLRSKVSADYQSVLQKEIDNRHKTKSN